MSKYIDAEKLKAQIKGLQCEQGFEDGMEERGYQFAIKDILDIIDSLQQEQPDLPGIEDPGIPGKDFIPVEWVETCDRYGKWRIVKHEQPEADLEKEMDKFYGTYRDKTGKAYAIEDDEPCFDWKGDGLAESDMRIARHFYELGLNARKEE